MESFFEKKDKRLTFEIHEDIDEYAVKKIRRRLDNEIERYMPKEVIFDFNKVTFMDSAGIGLVIGRYKLANILGGKVCVMNLTEPIRKIFEMSGILKIIPEISKELSKSELIRTGNNDESKCTAENRSQMCKNCTAENRSRMCKNTQQRIGPKCAKYTTRR